MTPADRHVAAAFPRQYARTRRFSLGHPRALTPAPDGARVAFLRSAAGDDPVQKLWVLDTGTGQERCVADPTELAGIGGSSGDDLPPEERALRERAREAAGGIVAYATDHDVRVAVFALAGRLHVCPLVEGPARRHACRHRVTDPRPDPAGERVAYASGGGLYVTHVDGGDGRLVAGPDRGEEHVCWGLAEFIAAEEMGRTRGHWWSPDGTRLAVTRVDTAAVVSWHISDPGEPAQPGRTVAYPAAGTANAGVWLYVVSLDGTRVRVVWDAERFPYLVAVSWREHGPLTLTVQSRDQKDAQVLAADPDSGATRLVREAHDPDWLEIVPGVPRWTADGRLVDVVDEDDTRKLTVAGTPVTPAGLQIRGAVHIGDDAVTVLASGQDPTAVEAWRVPLDGDEPHPLAPPGGVHHVEVRGSTTVLQRRDLTGTAPRTVVQSPSGPVEIVSVAETPVLDPRPRMLTLGRRGLRAALLLPAGHRAGDGRLPVLLDPYGGPHAQRVLQRRDAYTVSQWFAEGGFAVLVTDGRGSPGRGPAWERAVAGDLVSAPLDDQVDALQAAAADHPLDLDRVAIRGWSFGGYLAAAAVLRRPDVFHAAVAGAPVTDWTLYDTHYTERYLGAPGLNAGGYRHSSLLDDAPEVQRPVLLIHGLADDNVVVAHTLRLSRVLLARAHPHRVLPLTGVTHMTPQETVAENLLWLELDFLRDALRLEGTRS